MQKTAYELRISDWSSDVCSSDLLDAVAALVATLVVFYGLVPYFSARDAGRDPLFLQGVPEPVGLIASVSQHPWLFGQTVDQIGCASVIADLPSGHDEADRTTLPRCHIMQLVFPAHLLQDEHASQTP